MALDIAGMLTGVSNQPVNPNLSVQQQQLAMGANATNMMQGGMESMRRSAGGSVPMAEQLQMAMGSLDPSNPADAEKLIKLMMATGDIAGATKLASQIKAMQQKKIDEAKAKAAAIIEEKRYQDEFNLDTRKVVATEQKVAAANKANALKANQVKTRLIENKDGTYTIINEGTGAVIATGDSLDEGQRVLKNIEPVVQRVADTKLLGIKTNEMLAAMGRAEELIGVRRYQDGSKAEDGTDLSGTVIPDSIPGGWKNLYMLVQQERPGVGATLGNRSFDKLSKEIESIQAKLGLEALALLKSLSSTGSSGLGATNQMEISMLQQQIAALDATLPSELPKQFEIIREHMDNLRALASDRPVNIKWEDPKYSAYTREFDGVKAYTVDGGATFYDQATNQPIPE